MFRGIMEVVGPVYSNTYAVANGLGICEGIWKHAEELNSDHRHFFGLVTRYAVDAAVLGICKLYDSSNSKYSKDTVLTLNDHLRSHLNATYTKRINTELLVELGASEKAAHAIAAGLHSGADFSQSKEKLFDLIDRHMPQANEGAPLRRLFTHRNKVIAHQQQLRSLTALVREELKSLPSLDEMEQLNNWAMAFCRLIVAALSNETLLPHPVSARIAALNVAAKVLGKSFGIQDHVAEKAFYSRL
jgi:hypothetical protein